MNLDDYLCIWLVLLEAERLRNRITSSDKSFALPMIIISVNAYSYGYPSFIIPIIKSLSKNSNCVLH